MLPLRDFIDGFASVRTSSSGVTGWPMAVNQGSWTEKKYREFEAEDLQDQAGRESESRSEGMWREHQPQSQIRDLYLGITSSLCGPEQTT